MFNIHTYTFYTPGNAAANHVYRFIAPCDLQLIHVSASNSAATDATFTIGNSVTAAAYLAASNVGDSNTPNEFDRDDFVGGEFPHIVKGTVVAIAVDYDGSAGTAASNLTIVLTCQEG